VWAGTSPTSIAGSLTASCTSTPPCACWGEERRWRGVTPRRYVEGEERRWRGVTPRRYVK
jgi:hypothetical protein